MIARSLDRVRQHLIPLGHLGLTPGHEDAPDGSRRIAKELLPQGHEREAVPASLRANRRGSGARATWPTSTTCSRSRASSWTAGRRRRNPATGRRAPRSRRPLQLSYSLVSRTFCVWSSRNFASFCASPGSLSARIAIARRAALIAPGLPMASVPTGIRPASARWRGASRARPARTSSARRARAAACAPPRRPRGGLRRPRPRSRSSMPRGLRAVSRTRRAPSAPGAPRGHGTRAGRRIPGASRRRVSSSPSRTCSP